MWVDVAWWIMGLIFSSFYVTEKEYWMLLTLCKLGFINLSWAEEYDQDGKLWVEIERR